MAVLLKNAAVVTAANQKSLLNNMEVLIDHGVITAVGKKVKTADLRIQEVIDCAGRVVMPGLVNAHSHVTEILQRSFRDNAVKEVWRALRSKTEEAVNLEPEQITAAAALACGEMLKNGVTAVLDLFSTRPSLSMPKMRAILAGFDKTGIRGILAPSLRDQDLVSLVDSRTRRPNGSKRKATLLEDDFLRLLEDVRKSRRISIMLGPTSPLNCSESLLREVVDLAEKYDLGVHTHLLETRLDRWGADTLYDGKLLEHLLCFGFLSKRLSAAHGVWLDDKEIDLIAASNTSIVHNPASNLKLGSGIAPTVKLKRRGVNIALGTDGGDTSDTYSIFDQMRLATFVSRLIEPDPDRWITARDAFLMGTSNGAEAVPAWRGKIGKIQAGYRADLVILAADMRLCPLNDIIKQLVFSGGGHLVHTVFVEGKIVVKEGRLTMVDEEKLTQAVGEVSKRMHLAYGAIKKRRAQEKAAILKLYDKIPHKMRYQNKLVHGLEDMAARHMSNSVLD